MVIFFRSSSALFPPHYCFPRKGLLFVSTYRDITRTFRRRVLLFFFFFFFFFFLTFTRIFLCGRKRSRVGKIIQKRHLHTRTRTQRASSSSSSITAVHAPRRRRGSVFIRGGLVLFSNAWLFFFFVVLQICSSTSTNTSKTLYEDIIGFDEQY